MKPSQLEHLTEEQASQFVAEDMARFEHFGYAGEKLLVFNQTHNTYHKNKQTNNYERIGNMQIRPKYAPDFQI